MLHGTVYDYLRDDGFNATNALSGTTLPMNQSQFGGQPRRSDLLKNRTFYFANVEQRRLDQSGLITILDPATSPSINARLAAVGYQGRRSPPASIPNPVRLDQRPRQGRSSGQRPAISSACATASTTSTRDNSRGAGASTRRAPRPASTTSIRRVAVSNTLTLSPRTVLETRAQFAHGDLQAPPTDPIGPAVSIAGVASFGTLLEQSRRRGVNTLYQVVNNLSHQAARMRCGSASTSSTTTIGSPFRARSAAATRSRRWRTSWPASTTTPASRRRSAQPTSRRRIPTSASTRRTSGRSASRSR